MTAFASFYFLSGWCVGPHSHISTFSRRIHSNVLHIILDLLTGLLGASVICNRYPFSLKFNIRLSVVEGPKVCTKIYANVKLAGPGGSGGCRRKMVLKQCICMMDYVLERQMCNMQNGLEMGIEAMRRLFLTAFSLQKYF